MRRTFLALFALFVLSILPVSAGTTKDVNNGEVYGIWTAGSSHIIDDYAFVPQGKSLLVEEGVGITFVTPSSFDILGELIINGTADAPVVVVAPLGWEGFNFVPGRLGIDSIQYLIVGVDGGIPQHVIRAQQRNLKLLGCTFVGNESCLWISRGRIWADRNHFTSVGRFSATVRFDSLVSERISPWDPIDANYLTNSIVIADVPDAPLPPTIWRFTTALDVENSNEVVVAHSRFKVTAPGYAYGVFYGEPNASSATGATIQYCTIAARSFNVQARGVVNQYDGYLDMRFCTIDVGGGTFDPVGVSATNSAQTTVNSCILNLSTGRNFCSAFGAARVTVMHNVLWRSTASLVSQPLPISPPEEEAMLEADNLLSVEMGEGNIEADPQFVADGEWGQWFDIESVRAYYSLQPTSPCIDQGDAALDYDPDNTLPDIGCYYYSQTSSGTPPPGSISIPRSLVLAPYPNPFNATTVIPFALDRSGEVRLTVYDILGRPVADLANGQFAAGSHQARFHARGLPSGLYFVRMELNGVHAGHQKLMLIR